MGVPKIRETFLGVPMIRTTAHVGVCNGGPRFGEIVIEGFGAYSAWARILLVHPCLPY